MAHPKLEGCPKQKWPEDGKSFENPTGPELQLAALAVGVSKMPLFLQLMMV
ncbi:hypothetical protein ACTWQL_03985 [Pseudalkalibacillus sp. R45]|uniref:hypothetical protein n=1 Tax=Pseudalkalibacillus sp. R45 TaxID=3457433 RepID=UPI003FCE7787